MVRWRQTPEEAFWWTEIHGEIQDRDSKRQMKNQKLKLRLVREGGTKRQSLGKAEPGQARGGGEAEPRRVTSGSRGAPTGTEQVGRTVGMRRGGEGGGQYPLSEHLPYAKHSKAGRERKERGTEGEGTLGKGRLAPGLGRARGSYPKSEGGAALPGGGWGCEWYPDLTGFGEGEEEHRGVSASQPQLPEDALLPTLLLSFADCAGTRDPGDMGVRETRESPTAHVYREGSRDLHCKRGTEINTGNTYPAGVQSKYTGHVRRITDLELPPNPVLGSLLGPSLCAQHR